MQAVKRSGTPADKTMIPMSPRGAIGKGSKLTLFDPFNSIPRFFKQFQYALFAAEMTCTDDKEGRLFGHHSWHLFHPVAVAVVEQAVFVFYWLIICYSSFSKRFLAFK